MTIAHAPQRLVTTPANCLHALPRASLPDTCYPSLVPAESHARPVRLSMDSLSPPCAHAHPHNGPFLMSPGESRLRAAAGGAQGIVPKLRQATRAAQLPPRNSRRAARTVQSGQLAPPCKHGVAPQVLLAGLPPPGLRAAAAGPGIPATAATVGPGIPAIAWPFPATARLGIPAPGVPAPARPGVTTPPIADRPREVAANGRGSRRRPQH